MIAETVEASLFTSYEIPLLEVTKFSLNALLAPRPQQSSPPRRWHQYLGSRVLSLDCKRRSENGMSLPFADYGTLRLPLASVRHAEKI